MKIAIIADDTCDIPQKLIEKYNIYLVHLSNILGSTEYRGELTGEMIYDYVARTGNLPQTAAPSSVIYKEEFEHLLKSHDAVIHFSLSSGISSSYNNAVMASKELENVYVVDTLSLTSGSGILALKACEMAEAGKQPSEIVEEIEKLRDKVQASFLISKLDYLKKGGRCSSIAMFGANLLGLKILVQIQDGKMKATKKYMGKLGLALQKYLSDMVKEKPPVLDDVFIISSSDMTAETAGLLADLKALGFKNIWEKPAGSTICSHCGPGTLGIVYLEM